MIIRIVEGLDIPIAGAPVQVVSGRALTGSVALSGSDYPGLSPSLRVQVGDRVKLGQALFADRRHPEILFTSPGAGVVREINRGARRALLSVVVERDGDEAEGFPACPPHRLASLGAAEIRRNLLASGLWTAFRTRPYGKVPDPASDPHSIFVTAMDSNPLAPRPAVVIAEHEADFANGLAVLPQLTEGPVFLCKAPLVKLPTEGAEGITVAEFAGPHPSGLPGTHIHRLDPVGAAKTVWYLGYQDVIAIGKLFTSGRIWSERVVSLGGPPVREPRLLSVPLGADVVELCRDELSEEGVRIISGSVLSGREARAPESYLGRYHQQVSVIAETAPAGETAFTSYRAATSRWAGENRFALTSRMHGAPAAMVPFGQFEWVMPLDILPIQLLRALSVGDYDLAQALGCLELEEEDLALCSFVCPSKENYGLLLREALGQIEKEG